MSRHQFRTPTVCGPVALALTLGLLAGCGGDEAAAESGVPAGPSAPTTAVAAVAKVATTPEEGVVTGKGFAVRMPGDPEKSHQVASVGGKKLNADVYRYEGPSQTYTLTRVVYPKGVPLDLRAALEAAADRSQGLLATSRTLTYKGEPAIEGTIVGAKAEGAEAILFARYVLVDRVLYGLLYLDEKDGPKKGFQTFVNSLKVG